VPAAVLLYALHPLLPRKQLLGLLAGVGAGYAAVRAWNARR
jgi:hypothetical protein